MKASVCVFPVAVLIAAACWSSGCGSSAAGSDAGRDAASDVVADSSASDTASETAADAASHDSVGLDIPADSGRDAAILPLADYSTFGPHPVGHVHFELTDSIRGRTLPMELWYPAVESARAAFETGKSVIEMFDGEQRDLFAPLLENPSECLTRTVHGVRDAEPIPGNLPLVMFSHCGGCIRTSNISIAERLASHGFAVASADHIGDTLWDSLKGLPGSGLSAEFLEIRGADVSFILDRLLDQSGQDIPASIRGKFETDRVAMFGHSFGAMTTGYVTLKDARIKGSCLHAAPFAGFFGLIDPADCTKPVYTIVAVEDSMIYSYGNDLLREDFAKLNGPSWKVEVQDTGHLSFHDLCRVRESFRDCCGAGVRQTDFTEFTYMDQAESMQIAATYTTAFMAYLLLDDRGARTVFETPASDRVTIESRNVR